MFDLHVASARYRTDAVSNLLVEHLKMLSEELQILDPTVYYDFPLFRDPEGRLQRTRVLFASRTHGLVGAGVVSGGNSADQVELELDSIHSLLYGKLLQSRRLRKAPTDLLVDVSSILFDPHQTLSGLPVPESLQRRLISSESALRTHLQGQSGNPPLDESAWRELRALVEGTKTLIRPRLRRGPDDKRGPKAELLASLEEQVANLDLEQRRVALSVVDGPQRIRGLAGSGKTIVLALKAAYTHFSGPSDRILVTFHTKSLYEFLRSLITRFYRSFADEDPDWEQLHLRHSWGGKSIPGVYYEAAIASGTPPITFDPSGGGGDDPLGRACETVLASGPIAQRYEYVLMDEAQDFPKPFFRLCFELCKGGPYDRNVIWAYDDFQSIMKLGMEDPRALFGADKSGAPVIDLDRANEGGSIKLPHDVVLHTCYRNAREILVCAHALGLGVYSDYPVQMLENPQHWQDVGYRLLEGGVPGEHTVVERPEASGPVAVRSREALNEILKGFSAEDLVAEITWIVDEIRAAIADGLRPDDILIISVDDRNARTYFKAIADRLGEGGIVTNNLLSDPYNPPVFRREECVTCSTVYRAKGNEAAMVFVAGVDALWAGRKQQLARNKLFTAMTRGKAWVRLSGLGLGATYFIKEMETAKSHLPRIEFEYPDHERLVLIQRGLSERAQASQKLLSDFEARAHELGMDADDLQVLLERRRKKK